MSSKIKATENGTLKGYSHESKATFFTLRNYVLECTWTNSESIKFIVRNMELNSLELSKKYEADTGTQKSESTFRVQRAKASKILYSIFGTEVSDILICDEKEKILKLRNHISLLSEGSKDISSIFSGYVIDKMINLSESEKVYSIEACYKELLVLSKFSSEYFENQLSSLDLDKVKYVYDILSSSFHIGTGDSKALNKEKVNMLAEIKRYANVQFSSRGKISDGVSNNDSEKRIKELEDSLRLKDELIAEMKDRYQSDLAREVERRFQERIDANLFDNIEFENE